MTRVRLLFVLLACQLVTVDVCARAEQGTVIVGSKRFNESYILAELLAQMLESGGRRVDRRMGLGGTTVCYEALRNGEIHVYPEYSGTLEQAILKSPGRLTYVALRDTLQRRHGVALLAPFGFNNTYAIAVSRSTARTHGFRTIGDLAGVPGLRYAFSHEFINRKDGWGGLAEVYGLEAVPRGIEHALAYQAIAERRIDVTDVYSTDGDIARYDLVLLEDDRNYFPVYMGAPVVHASVDGDARRTLAGLAGKITDDEMRRLNARVVIDGASFAEVARGFLDRQGMMEREAPTSESLWKRMASRTGRHLVLTFVAVLAAVVIALPVGVFVYRVGGWARGLVYVAGMFQTIPSIALLAFMIPLFGIGVVPAIVALFLYALLPILRNTTTALLSTDPVIRRVSEGMGMTFRQRLWYVDLPMAAPTILAGVKTAAVINIGTATLAAFIGAGGLGEPIVTGLALNDVGLIMEGAVPAAALAVLVEFAFDGLERLIVPGHLVDVGSR